MVLKEWKVTYVGAFASKVDVTYHDTDHALYLINQLLATNVGWHLEEVREGWVHFHMKSNGHDWCWTFERVT